MLTIFCIKCHMQIGRSCLHTVAAARNANLISLLCSHDANPHSCENVRMYLGRHVYFCFYIDDVLIHI